ncbi:hypothetical protein [Trichocoleus sp. FACHB-90]|nr:hypothetical protein [Trichocoleus sp. FACHB-90]
MSRHRLALKLRMRLVYASMMQMLAAQQSKALENAYWQRQD